MAFPSTLQATRLRIRQLHQPGGWLAPAYVEVDHSGTISAVHTEQPAHWSGADVVNVDGVVVPGLPNLHSHAFQRAMAGLAEHGDPARPEDSFWTWRNMMYRFAALLGPDDVEAIAAQLYVEMLKAGMTHVGEFHYLHHAPDGQPYANRAELGLRIIRAAEQVGCRLTMLPVFYAHAGIGRPPAPHQARFIHADVQPFLELFQALKDAATPRVWVGIAPHSLRAVSTEELTALTRSVASDVPIHIHVAEQPAEVEECIQKLGARPVQHLLDQHGVDARWCLVHATHITPDERRRLAASGAVAGLCPTTEANLGDGLFPAVEYLQEGGRIGIGSDSNITVSAAEELRLLEYGQRLTRGRRNLLLDGRKPEAWSVGRNLLDAAVRGGRQALGQPEAVLVAGAPADLVVLDPEHPALASHRAATSVDAWIFASVGGNPVRDVMVAGRWVIQDGHHAQEEQVLRRFKDVMHSLREQC